MRTEVEYAGRPVGWIEWEPDAFGVQILLDCEIPDDSRALLRCYGRTDKKRLLVGLPEPLAGRLRLSRHLSRETLKAAGCTENPPEAFYLSETAQPPQSPTQEKIAEPVEIVRTPSGLDPAKKFCEPAAVRTGDEVLDALLASGEIAAERVGDAVELRCPFLPSEPFALAPGFVLCRVENGRAVLRYEKRDAAQ